MKPELKGKAIVVSEEAKEVLEILKKATKLLLSVLKAQSGLSNKKWDKAIKELTKSKLAKVTKAYDALVIELQD